MRNAITIKCYHLQKNQTPRNFWVKIFQTNNNHIQWSQSIFLVLVCSLSSIWMVMYFVICIFISNIPCVIYEYPSMALVMYKNLKIDESFDWRLGAKKIIRVWVVCFNDYFDNNEFFLPRWCDKLQSVTKGDGLKI